MTTTRWAAAAVATTAAVLATVAAAHPTPSPLFGGEYPTDAAEALALDTYAFPVGWTPPQPTHAPYVSVCDYQEHQSDETLWWRLTNGRSIGGCSIQTGSSSACTTYAKSAVPGATGDRGHPKSRENTGTGCVRTGRDCYFWGDDYELTDAERRDMCTADERHNAVAQIRHAIRNDACGDCERAGW